MAVLLAELARLEDRIVALDGTLPTQLIHADLHFDNVLTDPLTGKVTGLLDFEFACVDWRAMEPAVSLTK
jgi:Ser/Thr protein kinase RdoA (MazF antagonist)